MDLHIWTQSTAIAQGLGFLGFTCGVLAYLNRHDGRLKVLIGAASLIMALHFWLLGAYIGMAAACLSGVRSVVAAHAGARRLAPLFFVPYVPMAFIRIEIWVDVLPIISGIMATYAMFYLAHIPMRVVLLGATALWLVHNILHGSVGGTLLEAFYIGVNMLTIYRLRRERV